MSGRTSSARLDKPDISRSLGGWSSMRRCHRFIFLFLAGLFAGLTTLLPAEPPDAGSRGQTRKAVSANATKKPGDAAAPMPPGKTGADLMLQMAYAAYEAGNLSLALEKLDAADKQAANGAENANLRGAIFLRGDQFAKAAEQFRRAVNLDPSLWVARFNVAEVPFRQKDFVAARRAFENLAFETDRYKLEAEWELVQYKLIVCALLTGDAADAQKRFTRLRSNPASTAKIYAQAALSFARNDAASASKVLALAGTPGSAALKAIYADALVAAGWLAPTAAPNMAYDPTAGQRGGLRVRGLPVPLLPPALDVDLPKGSGSSLAGDSAAPIDELPLSKLPAADVGTPPAKTPPEENEAGPKASPAPKDSSEVRGRTEWRFAEKRASESQWIRAANEGADAYAAKVREAQAKLKARDLDGASQLLDEAIALNSKPAEALNLRGALEFYRGNYRAAEALFRKALVADPASWPARFDLAEIAFVEKEYARARGQYEAMLGGTSNTKQPVERELLQYKIVLTLLLEGKVAAAEKLADRLPLAGQTPAWYYSRIALDVSQKRFEKAAQALGSAEQFYPASLNFIFAQSLEKLSMLPLPAAVPPTAAAPAAAPNPTPQDEAPVRADLLPPPIADVTPAVELTESVLAHTEAQLLEEIVGGRAVASPPAAKAARNLTATAAVMPTPTPGAPVAPAPSVAASPRPPVSETTTSAHGWLASALQWLFPGTEPTRLETLLFALGAVNLLGLMYLLGADVIARLLRPRRISIHTAGAVGVSVNRLRIIERFRVRLSVANMTRHSQTVGHLDTVVVAPDGVRRTFHWKTLCLNPSGSSSFEEMEVFPLILLPGEVASLYVDFVADADESPTPWRRGKHEFHVMGWTAAATRRATPDFKVSFPLEIPNIPWKNQDIVVDLAIVRPGRKERVPSEFELLEWDDEEEDEQPTAESAIDVDLALAPDASAEADATTLPSMALDDPSRPPVIQPPPPSVIPPRPAASAPPVVAIAAVPVTPAGTEDSIVLPVPPSPLAALPPARIAPIAAAPPPATAGQIRPVTPVLPAPPRPNPEATHGPARPPLSRTPFLSGPGNRSDTTPQVLPALGRPASSTPTLPVGPLVPMIKAIPRAVSPPGGSGRQSPPAASAPKPAAPAKPAEPLSLPAAKLPPQPPEPPAQR